MGKYRRWIVRFALAIAASLLAISAEWPGIAAKEVESTLPPLQVHPLPPSLAQWQPPAGVGDYFDRVKPSPVGYLVWSELPIKIYIERPAEPEEMSAEVLRFHKWVGAVLQGVEEWKAYLPLVEVGQAELADIAIERSRPPLASKNSLETGKVEVPRARSAQTRYQFYLKPTDPPRLSHRMTVQIAPGLGDESTLAAARHELGHALGIWGHSPLETDALYFSQVRNPPPISPRDVNTLKKVYQQPTRLGWALPAKP